jgi:hypothetical protein
MNNYSDLLDINNYKLSICIQLEPVGCPDIEVTVAENVHVGLKLNNLLKLEYQVNLLDLFLINIELKNKIYTLDYETAIIIRQLSIDNINLIPKFDYLANYDNDHNNNNPTNYLGFNGNWSLTFDRPFYQWIHLHTAQGLLVY